MTNFNIGKKLQQILPPDRIKTRYIDLVTYAADAGFYYLVPKAVVQPVSEGEITALFCFSSSHEIPLVFRGGGTSLSGQSITDGILVDLSQFWNKITVEQEGMEVRVQPGITGAMVNRHLSKFRRKIGPDPSSISSAMMGGILSNNSSGMCCGVLANAYHTTRHIRFILPNGKIFDTGAPEDYLRFEKECPGIYRELTDLKHEIMSDTVLQDRIRQKFRTKNTVGYALNAFVDFVHPLEILARLLIGGEGTLAFISEAVLRTIPDFEFKSTALLYFPDLDAACQAIIPLIETGAQAVELMDRASLRAVEGIRGMPEIIKSLPDKAAALLVEFQESQAGRLMQKVDEFLSNAGSLSMLASPNFTTDKKEQEFLWQVRKGLFPSVGAVRRKGTSVILEDVAFPVKNLGAAIGDLQTLFKKFRYDEAIVFGHAKDGNIHFVITQTFNEKSEVDRYEHFIADLVELVIKKYDGALKAEHGTGRNMAPFVETEWGSDAYRIMERLKKCIDPENLLNPGVILNTDHEIHIKNLKQLSEVEEEVDKCIECGYCEHVCPSRNLTMTPRRRIVARRELRRLQTSGEAGKYRALLKQYRYEGLETCAVDGLCASACPVDINTGDLIKRLRTENHSQLGNLLALFVAKNFKWTEWAMRFMLRMGSRINGIFGRQTMYNISRFAKKCWRGFPLWTGQIGLPPRVPGSDLHDDDATKTENGRVIYFPTCISRLLGDGKGEAPNIMETMISVLKKAGVRVIIPKKLGGTCCGQIFSSKGFNDAYRVTANNIVDYLWAASSQGLIPIVTDASSCAYTFQHIRPKLTDENKLRFDRMTIMDSVDYLHDIILPLVGKIRKAEKIVLHPVCSLSKMGSLEKFKNIARHFANEVSVPVHSGCCGMAGDRGFLFPELTHSATLAESQEVANHKYEGYYSSARTCEMAMTEAVQQNYKSIIYLADKAMI